MRRTLRLAAAFALAGITLAGSLATAVSTRTFRITTGKDFDEGESEGTLLSSLGEVVAGMGARRIDGIGAAQLFSSVAAPDGTVWLGAGDQAELFAFDGKAARSVCKLEGVLVSALAAAPDGTIYAATLPGARLYRLTGGAAGKCAELGKLEGADQVWALLVEPAKGRLLAATGPTGKLFSVELGSGKSKVLWDSGQKHLMSLLGDGATGLIVGTGDEGILYRIGGDGESARVVHDFGGDEVRALSRVGDKLFVAVNEFEHNKGASSPPASSKPIGTKITPPTTTSTPAAPQPPGRDRKGKGGIFRVDTDGRVEQLHALSDGYFTALDADAQGNVYAAAASNGRVYQIRPDRTVLTAFTLAERQVLTLSLGGRNPILGTGDAGALYAVEPSPAKGSRWVSKVLDASYPARWGSLRYTASGPVTVETRAGNTAKPDKAWSEWQAVGGGGGGGDAHEGKVKSPAARYLQIRATLGREGRLLDVAAWYLAQNQRARLTEITVGEDSASGVARGVRAAGKPRSPVVKIRWKFDNPDDDDLVFRLAYKLEGEPNWKPLGGPDPLTAKDFDWNTESIPDGKYLVRVIASDERANPREELLDHELVSAPVLVDNKKPEVTLKAAPPLLSGSARDSFSPISDLAFSIDGGDYQPLAPRDRLFDDLTEEFAIKLPETLAPGAHSVTVKATDSADNVGLGQASFTVGK